MRVTFSSGLAAFHSSIRAWTLPSELSLPWTQVMGPVPSRAVVPPPEPDEPSEPPEQAAAAARVAATTELWMNLRRGSADAMGVSSLKHWPSGLLDG